jgi:uncharacterized membrane protein
MSQAMGTIPDARTDEAHRERRSTTDLHVTAEVHHQFPRLPHNPKGAPDPSALDENVQAIHRWEQDALHSRSPAERLSDWITTLAGSGPVQLAHVAWFAGWLFTNTHIVPGIEPFDPFPFPLLTTIVSLEAIFLALFVLASQNRLSHQSDKRAHLDLQVDLLAEREMTAVLRLLQDIGAHLGVKVALTPDQIRDLTKKTDIHQLTNKLEDVPAETDSRRTITSDEK